MAWFKQLWKRVSRWWTGNLLVAQLADAESETRSAAELAVARVVAQTNIPPDCVVACVLHNGCCIQIRHDTATEAFLHNTYAQAADKAIEWYTLRGGSTRGWGRTTQLSKKQQKVFNAVRQADRSRRLH